MSSTGSNPARELRELQKTYFISPFFHYTYFFSTYLFQFYALVHTNFSTKILFSQPRSVHHRTRRYSWGNANNYVFLFRNTTELGTCKKKLPPKKSSMLLLYTELSDTHSAARENTNTRATKKKLRLRLLWIRRACGGCSSVYERTRKRGAGHPMALFEPAFFVPSLENFLGAFICVDFPKVLACWNTHIQTIIRYLIEGLTPLVGLLWDSCIPS